ncbi:DUF4139 domain-containing protein, partial [Streptomyces massasporeus]
HELSVAADRLARASSATPSTHVETTVSAVLTLVGADGDAEGEGGPRAEGEPDLELELEYGVPGAVWVPAYRLTHRQGDGTGRLVLRASVAQRTGEDWTGVRIALATADLRRRTDLPKLRSIRIGRRPAAPAPSGWREPPAGLADLFAGYAAAGPRPPAPRTPGAAGGTAGGAPLPVAAGAGFVPDPVALPAPPISGGPPIPPPAPQAYGAPPPEPAGGYGSAPEAFRPGASPDFARRSPAPPGGMPRGGGRSFAGAPAPAAMAPAAPAPLGAAPAPPPPPPPPGPPRPSGDELDYAALVLSGPDEPSARRGRLFPGSPSDAVAAEHRRRADAVASLALPGHAVRPRESAGSFDHRFDAAARADVPSDGTWHTVTVGEIPVGLRTEYLCVPSVEQTVYATLV